MIYEIAKVLLSPVFISFFAISAGYYIGKIQFKHISFGLSGVLIISAAFGLAYSVIKGSMGIGFTCGLDPTKDLKAISSLGSAVFISSIGLRSGYGLKKQKDILWLAPFAGIIVILNILVMSLILLIDKSVSPDLIYGVFCGAMTSSPGLAALSDGNINSEQAGIGYGMSYLIGVIGIVLFAQIRCCKNTDGNCEARKTEGAELSASLKPSLSGLIQIAVSVISGYVIGSIKIPFINVALGISGGILISALLVGYILSKFSPDKRLSGPSLDLLRDLGLSLFFVGNGFSSGSSISGEFSLKPLIYGAVLTIAPIIFAALIGRIVLKKKSDELTAIVCGVMTSTPAITVLLTKRQSEEDITALYIPAYTGALITMVIFMNLI